MLVKRPPVGVTDGLKKGDKVFGARRSHGHLLALNPDAKKFFQKYWKRNWVLWR